MDSNPHEIARPDARARRVRTAIVILTVVLIAAPFVVYLLVGKGVTPGQ
jgi:hypothetical protein